MGAVTYLFATDEAVIRNWTDDDDGDDGGDDDNDDEKRKVPQRSPVEISPIKRGLFEDIRRLWDQFQAKIGHFTLYCHNEIFGLAKA